MEEEFSYSDKIKGRNIKTVLERIDDRISSMCSENQADSEATTVELLVADFNALLAKLKAAGLMAADEVTENE